MSFDNLNLRVKNLIPLSAMLLTMLAVLGFGALTLLQISERASNVVERRDVGTAKLLRAARLIAAVPATISANILVDNTAELAKSSDREFRSAPDATLAALDDAIQKIPGHADQIQAIRSRFIALYEQAKPVYKEVSAMPGLSRGRALKPDELDMLSAETGKVALIFEKTDVLVQDIATLNSVLFTENAEIAKDLRDRSSRALVTLGVAGLLGAAVALAFSLWVTIAKVERPLNRLGGKMRDLAGGDLNVEIDEDGRRDEIGEMARAVTVFKTNALERLRAESETTTARAAAETERATGLAERARIAQSQTAAMSALRTGLRQFANGDLTARLTDGFSGEFVEVRDDFNAASDKLKSALGLVARSTGAIQSSSQEISSASDNLSQRTEQQAASLEETAAALEEITNTLRASAENAQHAAQVVANADSDAKKGAVVVRQAVEAMDDIAASSNKIGQIIGVIDEIAFQTNLLALNAGVEAARAGDSGRGFAVVAMEVRALAQRSAEAAKEIKALVSNSGAQVHSGVKLVAETGKALESIITQVSEINKVVGEIAEATRQQATGVAEINTAISQMDQTTQQNATMVEESTAASHALSRETSELSRLVEQFRLAGAGDEDLRRDLKSVAPHAFAKPAAAPPRAKSGAGPKLAAKSVGGGDWAEF